MSAILLAVAVGLVLALALAGLYAHRLRSERGVDRVWRALARPGVGAGERGAFDAYADGRGRMRSWLAGLVPVVGADGPDVSRSAAGRLMGESFLAPSALLPSRGARWEGQDDATVRVRLEAHGETVVLTLRGAPDGSLERIGFPRWNADPRNGPVGYLPFVSDGFDAERTFEGRTLPTRFRAGWRLDEEGAYPFYFVDDLKAAYVPVTPPTGPGPPSDGSGPARPARRGGSPSGPCTR